MYKTLWDKIRNRIPEMLSVALVASAGWVILDRIHLGSVVAHLQQWVEKIDSVVTYTNTEFSGHVRAGSHIIYKDIERIEEDVKDIEQRLIELEIRNE